MSEYPFIGQFVLDTGEVECLDLGERGWADKERLAHTVELSLRPLVEGTFPTVAMTIPPGGKPVFKARVFGVLGQPPAFRCFALGYKRYGHEHLTWVLPNGTISIGPDPLGAEELLTLLTS